MNVRERMEQEEYDVLSPQAQKAAEDAEAAQKAAEEAQKKVEENHFGVR